MNLETNKCDEKPATQEICDAKNQYFNRLDLKCEEFLTCAEDEILEKDQNYCAKKPSDEVCNRIDTYFNPILEECQAWKTCTDGLFLNRFNNQCLDEFTYQTQCELQNKFWNKAEVTCEEWKICDINTELDITINLCQ